ncbi:uncharacterized protein LOC121374778 [Gigantopelta aegis]|uniref:uncharacterized protein LOC121374778 n=1 Tax=Gigantopelta aegis TaxID=1735272 RepID=UPI001B887EB3|nr:uncharacterized protein LOC121374778 [Gigantopelta aegis]
MGNKCVSGCFVLHIILSLLLHLAELVTNGMLAYCLWVSYDLEHKWFSLITGIIIIPLVFVQLLSAILLLNRRGDSMTTCQSIIMAVLHLLQMGFTWRHVSVITERNILTKKADVAELFLLRMTYGFAAGFPLMLVQAYLILEQTPLLWPWILYAAAGSSLLSTSWALASFQRQHETCDAEDIVLPWPGMVFRLLWRTGEIISRVLSLVLFATLYKEWLFLVISLHWLTMLVCVCTSVFSAVSESVGSTAYKISFRVLVAYMYVFTFINFSHVNPMFRYIMFYIIMFLENGTLNIVWLLKSSSQDTESRYLMIFISAASFFVAIVSVAVYYKFFHVSISNIPAEGKSLVCVQKSCINCKLSLCVKHKLKMQRPFSAGWFSQYSSAVYSGQYYKNILHDSLLDDTCDSEMKSMMGESGLTASKTSENRKTQLSERENSDHEKQSIVSFQSAGTYVHRRYINVDDTEVLGDTAVDNSLDFKELCSPGQAQDSLSDGSSLDSGPPWLPPQPKKKSVSQTCLLTDHWDSLSDLEIDDSNKRRSLASCRSLMRENTHNWYSDGYSTDCGTLDWSKLPVTVIGRSRPVVSDSESEYYCHCSFKLPSTVRDVKLRTQNKKSRNGSSQPQKCDSLTNSVKEKYVHWSRKGTPVQRTRHEAEISVTNNTTNTHNNTGQEGEVLSEIGLEIHHTNRTKPDDSFVNVCETRGRKQHEVKKCLPLAGHYTDRETENLQRTEMVDGVTSSKMRTENQHEMQINMSGDCKEDSLQIINNFVADSFSNWLKTQEGVVLFPKMAVTAPVIGSQHSSFKPVVKNKLSPPNCDEKYITETSLSPQQASAITRSKLSNSGHNGQMTTLVLNTFNLDKHAKQTSYLNQNEYEGVVYENVAFVEDDGVFLDDPIPVTKETPWYVCSESEDSAFPQETFSSSNCEASNSEGESDDSLELII